MLTIENDKTPHKGSKKDAIIANVVVVGIFFLAYGIGQLTGHVAFLERVAISPLKWQSLPAIFTFELGHIDFRHLTMNMVQMGFLTFYLTRIQGWRKYIQIFLVSLVGSGLFTWIIAPPTALIIGASGITAGLASYLFVRSGIAKDIHIFAISGVFVALTIIGIVSAILAPTNMSWHAHVGGMLAGIILACIHELVERRDANIHSVLES